jgi:apolipoprotein N-acyltransferase
VGDPWHVVGVHQPRPTQARKLGAIYGFSLSFIFLWIDTSGSTSPAHLLVLLLVTTGLGVFGGLCGATLSVATHRLSQKLRKR